MYIALWFYIAAIVAVAMVHIVNSLAVPITLLKSYPVYAGVQEQWMRRGTPLGAAGRVVIPKPWSDVEDQRAALWFALGLVSIVPWAYVAFGRKAPVDVLYGGLACSAVVLLLIGLLAAFARANAEESSPVLPGGPPRD